MILLDTVVLSELRKSRPNAGVVAYLQRQAPDTIFISALTIGEIEAGICPRISAMVRYIGITVYRCDIAHHPHYCQVMGTFVRTNWE